MFHLSGYRAHAEYPLHAMRTGLPAEGFLRHRALILAAAGGAVAEAGLLTLVAPTARSVAPQVTAMPSLAAYHDVRWLFTDTQSWLWFAGLVLAVLLARSALDVVLLRLAWPHDEPAPRVGRAFVSCAALTLVAWVLLSPAVTLAFGVAVLPFSWPFLAAFPIMLGIAAALSHGGVVSAWWRRLPPARAIGWFFGSFVVLTASAALTTHLSTGLTLGVTAVAGLVNARAWYGLAGVAARLHLRAPESVPARVLLSVPFAPIAALLVLALVVGVTRLMFDGTIQLPVNSATASPSAAETVGVAPRSAPPVVLTATRTAVLVVAGWGSSCCDGADGLRATLPGVTVRQFSYAGLDARGLPLPSGPAADDLPLPQLGDRIAAQVRALHAATNRPVAVVAESEGTLGVYAMLARDPGLPLSAVVLLSPIIGPDQVGYPVSNGGSSVSEDALNELNHLVGGMSPYGESGAQDLLSSVSEFGGQYFSAVASGHSATSGGKPIRWLVVVPLADAVTLPPCGLPPQNVLVVPAFHGGLLGDGTVLPLVAAFVSGRQVSTAGNSTLREAAEVITGAAIAWRMPQTNAVCPSTTR
jgi:hypothetical protein